MKERGLLTFKKIHLCIPYGFHYPELSKYASLGAYLELLQFLFAEMFPILPKLFSCNSLMLPTIQVLNEMMILMHVTSQVQ
jgi:hypothetical protein